MSLKTMPGFGKSKTSRTADSEDGLNAVPQLSEDNETRWRVYTKIHALNSNSASFHLFNLGTQAEFVLIERLSDTQLLFVTFPETMRVVILEEKKLQLQNHLNQAQPDFLTQSVLDLTIEDLKPASNRALGETQPIPINL